MFLPVMTLIVLSIILKVIWEIRANRRNTKLLEVIEKRQPKYDLYKIFPHPVRPLKVERIEGGRVRLVFTLTSIRQIEKVLFVIGVKAEAEPETIAFELRLDGKGRKYQNQNTGLEEELMLLSLNTNLPQSDSLLRVLASLFSVEISDKSQIIKDVVFLANKQNISLESLNQRKIFTAFFYSASPLHNTPAWNIILDIPTNEMIIEEIDPLYRPIIINHLTFKPNIKS